MRKLKFSQLAFPLGFVIFVLVVLAIAFFVGGVEYRQS